MRKIFGFFMVLVAFAFLGMAYAQLAHAETPDCESALATKLVEAVKADKSKILEMQFELTALKLARESLTENVDTVEAYIKKQTALIAKLDDSGVRAKLRNLYKRHGQAEDAAKIDEALQASVDKAKSGSYYKRAVRFKNKDLSAYVLANTFSDAPAGFDMNDVAILWFKSEISEGVEAKAGRGSAAANLQEVSTRVAQLTGVAGTVGKSKAEIEDLITAHEQVIGEAFDKLIRTYADDLKKSCAVMNTCKDCPVNDAQNRLGDDVKKKALGKALTSIVDNLQKDEKAREATVKKVMAEVKASTLPIECESPVAEAEKPAPATATVPSSFGKDPGAATVAAPSAAPSVNLADTTTAQLDTLYKAPADTTLVAPADTSFKAPADTTFKAPADTSLVAPADTSLKVAPADTTPPKPSNPWYMLPTDTSYVSPVDTTTKPAKVPLKAPAGAAVKKPAAEPKFSLTNPTPYIVPNDANRQAMKPGAGVMKLSVQEGAAAPAKKSVDSNKPFYSLGTTLAPESTKEKAPLPASLVTLPGTYSTVSGKCTIQYTVTRKDMVRRANYNVIGPDGKKVLSGMYYAYRTSDVADKGAFSEADFLKACQEKNQCEVILAACGKNPKLSLPTPMTYSRTHGSCKVEYSVANEQSARKDHPGIFRKVTFLITRPDQSFVCKGSYTLGTMMIKDEGAWNPNDARASCADGPGRADLDQLCVETSKQ